MANFTPEELERYKKILDEENQRITEGVEAGFLEKQKQEQFPESVAKVPRYDVVKFDESNPQHKRVGKVIENFKKDQDELERAHFAVYGALPYEASPEFAKYRVSELFPEKSNKEVVKKQPNFESAIQKKSEPETSVNKPLSSQDRKILGLPEEKVMSFLQSKNNENKLLSDVASQPQNEDYLKLLQKQKEEEQNRPKAGRLVWNPETGTQEFVKTDKPQMKISDLWKGSTPEERASSQFEKLNTLREFDKNRDESVKKSSQLQQLEDIINQTKLPERVISSEVSNKPLAEEPAKTQSSLVKKAASIPVEQQTGDDKIIEAIKKESEAPKKEATDFTSLLEQAKAARDKQQLMAGLGRAGETLSSAVTGMVKGGVVTKPTGTDFYKDLAKQAEQGIEDVGTQYTMEQKQEERDRLARRRDPSSEESQFARALLKDQGITLPETATAEALEKYAPQLTNILNQREAQKYRTFLAQQAKEARLDKDKEKEADAIRDLTTSYRKELNTGEIAKLGTFARKAASGIKLMEAAAKDPSGYKDFAASFALLKATQGDDSVIREAELKLGMSLGSVPEKFKANVIRFLTGQMQTPEMRKQMLDSMRLLADRAQAQYMDAAGPVLNSARKEGIDVKNLLSETFLDQPEKLSTQDSKPKKQFQLPKKYSPGSKITTKQGVFIVDPSGDTATEE